MPKVSEATVKKLQSRSMSQNLELMKSGKLDAEETEAMKRFYPGHVKDQQAMGKNKMESAPTGPDKSAPKKAVAAAVLANKNTKNSLQSAAARRLAHDGPKHKTQPGKNLATGSKQGPGSPWQRFQKGGGVKGVTDTKGKGSPWQQYVNSRKNAKSLGKQFEESDVRKTVAGVLNKVTGHSARQEQYKKNRVKEAAKRRVRT